MMDTQDLPAHFRSAKALLAYVRDQRVAALKARFPPWYVRFHDRWAWLLVLAVLLGWVLVAVYLIASRMLPPGPLSLPAAFVYAFCSFLVLASSLLVHVGYRARAFPSALLDLEVSTPARRDAAFAKATDPGLVRNEALAILRAFLEAEQATLLPDGHAGFRDPAQPTGIRVACVEEAVEVVRGLERWPDPVGKIDLVALRILSGGVAQGETEERENRHTDHFTETFDRDIAPRLRAAFTR